MNRLHGTLPVSLHRLVAFPSYTRLEKGALQRFPSSSMMLHPAEGTNPCSRTERSSARSAAWSSCSPRPSRSSTSRKDSRTHRSAVEAADRSPRRIRQGIRRCVRRPPDRMWSTSDRLRNPDTIGGDRGPPRSVSRRRAVSAERWHSCRFGRTGCDRSTAGPAIRAGAAPARLARERIARAASPRPRPGRLDSEMLLHLHWSRPGGRLARRTRRRRRFGGQRPIGERSSS